ncbi:MAG: DUF2237 domain-containing protein [Pseudomonadota bacterium]
MEKDDALNVLGEPMSSCGEAPLTGFFRDGYCNTCREDRGSHTVCARVTEEFLSFSKSRGNDLSTPQPNFGFPGLRDGDRWCLCAGRWLEAYENDAAPRVYLQSTHQRAIDVVPLDVLRRFAVDLS